jgi:hypothetical protein
MRLTGYATGALSIAGGLLAGNAIREAIHHGHSWPLLAVLGVAAWAAAWLTLYLPYRAERRKLLRQRGILLGMMAELNEMAENGLTGGERP